MKKANRCIIMGTLILLLAACKSTEYSPDYGQGVGNCRIEVTQDSTYMGITTYNWKYDDENRLSSITANNGDVIDFIYFNGGYCRKSGFSNDSFFTDASNNLIKYKLSSTTPSYNELTYNSNHELIYNTIVTDIPSFPIRRDTIFYYWENGCITSIAPPDPAAETINFTYYPFESFQAGDVHAIDEYFKYGRVLTKTKHLQKTKMQNHNPLYYSFYTFDNNHKIIHCLYTDSVSIKNGVTSANRIVRDITYDCN